MTKIKPLIIWEKWNDPFGRDIDEAKWTDYNSTIGDSDFADHDYHEEDIDQPKIRTSSPIRVIASPMGLIPYNEYTASSKIFNFWLGHSNFNISEQIKNILENIAGIEILDIFTRYRFRIAIGKCFNDSEVMKNINDVIYNHISSIYDEP